MLIFTEARKNLRKELQNKQEKLKDCATNKAVVGKRMEKRKNRIHVSLSAPNLIVWLYRSV